MKKISRVITTFIIVLAFGANISSTSTVFAEDTSYTVEEKTQIADIQNSYNSLDNKTYNKANLYQTSPLLSQNFQPGILSDNAINGTLNWINYYRKLSGLDAVTLNKTTSNQSQIASSVMAASLSNPFLSQHFLANTQQQNNINDKYWNQAVYATGNSNLYFGYPRTLSEPIKELVIDNTNIDGLDTGHRAWFLSPQLSSVGIGITIANNGRQYENIFVNNVADTFNDLQKNIVTYPNNGVFPFEELEDATGSTNIPWSISFAKESGNIVTDNTEITVTNLSDGTSGTVKPINDKSYVFASDVISFLPPNNVTIDSHSKYQVTINNLNSEEHPSYSYTFKTFSESK
ncbi:CAP domain-containing protein [Lactobacillus terrae]|uniref:CAP domain-containing protein n=1 Tax=Lactobacillus terrae TaxID=2269374 RepID=UPI000C1B7149|nr:CAP domain-containing protein [Lactobacillus terrae]